MNSIDTPYAYNSNPYPRNSRVEIYFDQSNFTKQNFPINARLMYYKYPQRKESSFHNNFHSEQSSPVCSPRASSIHPSLQQVIYTTSHSNAAIPPLLRSVSLPTIKDPTNPQLQQGDSQADSPTLNSPIQAHSRKSSILSNCTHSSSHRNRSNSCVSCTDSIITINDSDDQNSKEDVCKRHHHRRESIAIKFKNPQIIDDIDNDNELMVDDERDEEQEQDQEEDQIDMMEGVEESDVFESLKNYELK